MSKVYDWPTPLVLIGDYHARLTCEESNAWSDTVRHHPAYRDLIAVRADADAILALLHKCHPDREKELTDRYVVAKKTEQRLLENLYDIAADWHRKLRASDPTPTPPPHAPAA